MCEERICACCQYFRSVIHEQDVAPEQDWGLCAIRDLRNTATFAPTASNSEKEHASLEESEVEGTDSCHFYTKRIIVTI